MTVAVDQPRRWTVIGHGPTHLISPGRQEAPRPGELRAAWAALGRAVPAGAWAVRLLASQDEIVWLMEHERALLCCVHEDE